MPESQYQRKKSKLGDVVTAIDEPKNQPSVGELIVDPETGGNASSANNQGLVHGMQKRRLRTNQKCKARRRHNGEPETESKDSCRMPMYFLADVLAGFR